MDGPIPEATTSVGPAVIGTGAAGAWRETFARHQAALLEDLTSRLDLELRTAVSNAETAATQVAQRTTAEALNQTLRRLRQAPSESAVLELLAEATTPWAQKTVVLVLENNQARVLAVRNMAVPHSDEIAPNGEKDEARFTFELDAAGAVRSALDSKDPLVALASGGEVSSRLAAAFAGGADEPTPKAYLFPVLTRQNVTAMLIASGSVTPAPLEMLCEAAGMKLELLTAPVLHQLKSPELVQIEASAIPNSAAEPAEAQAPLTWEQLSADDQKLHLRAQRVARVRVAEMRLYSAEELRKGVFAGDIYSALRPGIDAARTDFLQTFLSKSPTMVDYLHLEILRSLAHDDDRLLGEDYPGPMV